MSEDRGRLIAFTASASGPLVCRNEQDLRMSLPETDPTFEMALAHVKVGTKVLLHPLREEGSPCLMVVNPDDWDGFANGTPPAW